MPVVLKTSLAHLPDEKIDDLQRLVNFTLVLICCYAPFYWMLFIGMHWRGYLLLPLMPATIPVAYLRSLLSFDDAMMFSVAALIAPVIVASLLWLGMGGWKRLALACALSLGGSIPSSWVAHALYAM